MRNTTWTGLLCALVLAGCASTAPVGTSSPTPAPAAPSQAQAPAPAQQQTVAIPAAAARKVVLNMTGPKNVIDSSSWASFKEEWRATFADHARDAGIAFSLQEGDARPTGEAGTLLAVHVNDFRQVGIGARLMLGIMSGNAFIDAKVRFLDLRDGTAFGAQDYNTSSSAWHGIFAKMTPQQVDAIGTGVFGPLKAAR